MHYKVDWIINGELEIEASSSKQAEETIEKKLSKLIKNNKELFSSIGATAIQGNASVIKDENN